MVENFIKYVLLHGSMISMSNRLYLVISGQRNEVDDAEEKEEILLSSLIKIHPTTVIEMPAQNKNNSLSVLHTI